MPSLSRLYCLPFSACLDDKTGNTDWVRMWPPVIPLDCCSVVTTYILTQKSHRIEPRVPEFEFALEHRRQCIAEFLQNPLLVRL
jgi:hypothetical protein